MVPFFVPSLASALPGDHAGRHTDGRLCHYKAVTGVPPFCRACAALRLRRRRRRPARLDRPVTGDRPGHT